MANTNWENLPSTNTPINDENLNKISAGIVNIGTSVDSSYNTNLIYSKNLFDKNNNDNIENAYLKSTGETGASNDFFISYYIEIPQNANKITISGSAGENENICFYNSSKTFITYANMGTDTTKTIDIPSGSSYLRATIKYTSKESYQIEVGDTATTYSSFIPNSMYVNGNKFTETIGIGTSVNSANRVNVLHSKNLYNISNTINASINYSTGAITSETNFRTIYFKCKPNTTYTFSEGIQSNRYVVGFYSSFITTGTLTNITNSATFTSPSTAKYCYIMVSKVSDETSSITDILNSIMINEGSTLLPYEPYVIPSIVADNEEIYNQNIMNYSYVETKIGTWVNGKPLYRSVISLGSMPNATSKQVSHNISNIDNIVKITGFCYTSSGVFLPLPYIDVSGLANGISIFSNKTTIYTQAGTDRSSLTGYAIIEYTKTTD